MGVDVSTLVYGPNFDFWGRPIIVYPLVSQPGAASYSARGIWDTDGIEFPADAMSMVGDQKTICDIKEDEFAVLPMQGDHIYFPTDPNGPAMGPFEITDLWTNAGGETTLALKKVIPQTPLPPLVVTPYDQPKALPAPAKFNPRYPPNTDRPLARKSRHSRI